MTLSIILSYIVLFLATSMIFLKTPINTALCLGTVLLLSTIILFIAHVEFLSYVFILVYVGGIVLLFLFVIIMLNLKVDYSKSKDSFRILSGSTVLFLFFIKLQSILFTELTFMFDEVSTTGYMTPRSALKVYHFLSNDIMSFGLVLYTHYFFYFLLSGVILLIAMVGVLVLSLNNIDTKALKNLNYSLIPLLFSENPFNLGDKYLNEPVYYTPIGDNLYSIVSIEFMISFAITLFILAMTGMLFNKQKNVIVFMLFVELMLFSLSFLLIALSLLWVAPQGQIFALLIMCVAVSESAIGLGILIAAFRVNQKIEFDNFSYLRG